MRYSVPKLVEVLATESGLVLATIVEAAGSTPQVPGASAIFGGAGLLAGTVGGGLLEARVESVAAAARRDGHARLVSIRLDADPADMEGAICGGAARVLVDPGVGEARAVFGSALDGFRGRRIGLILSRIAAADGSYVHVLRSWLPAEDLGAEGSKDLSADERRAAGEALRDGRPRLTGEPGRLAFLEPVRPLPRLVIAGAGHVGKAVARLGALLDFSVTVVDDRAEFASPANVPEADEVLAGEIGATLAGLGLSTADYFVIVTRGHAKDAEALRAVVRREAAYVGMIGSRTKIGLMRREFLEKGWATAGEWARVHAPIGLDIGSQTVEEIAVSIAAELVRVRAGLDKGGVG
jgi:xanthine dehydrogenase accessory factor